MKTLLGYQDFLESLEINLSTDIIDLNESLSVLHELVLDALSKEDIDLIETFNLIEAQISTDNLENLLDDPFFLNSLRSIGLKKSQLQNTDDYQTFLKRTMRFCFIYPIESTDLEEPLYIIYQVWNEPLEKWDEVRLRKLQNEVKKFYDKLTSKTIELSNSDTRWIYYTSNANEWYLQNLDKLDKDFKKVLKKEDLENLIKTKGLVVKII